MSSRLIAATLCAALLSSLPVDSPALARQPTRLWYGFLQVNVSCRPHYQKPFRLRLTSNVFAYCPPTVTTDGILQMAARDIRMTAAFYCGTPDNEVTYQFVNGAHDSEAQAVRERERERANPNFERFGEISFSTTWYCPVWAP